MCSGVVRPTIQPPKRKPPTWLKISRGGAAGGTGDHLDGFRLQPPVPQDGQRALRPECEGWMAPLAAPLKPNCGAVNLPVNHPAAAAAARAWPWRAVNWDRLGRFVF
jgi:hypothetical protein